MSVVDWVCKKSPFKVLQNGFRHYELPSTSCFPASLTHAQTLPLAVVLGKAVCPDFYQELGKQSLTSLFLETVFHLTQNTSQELSEVACKYIFENRI